MTASTIPEIPRQWAQRPSSSSRAGCTCRPGGHTGRQPRVRPACAADRQRGRADGVVRSRAAVGCGRVVGPGRAASRPVLVGGPRSCRAGGQRPERADPLRPGIHPDMGGIGQVAGHLPEQGCGIESALPRRLASLGDRSRHALRAVDRRVPGLERGEPRHVLAGHTAADGAPDPRGSADHPSARPDGRGRRGQQHRPPDERLHPVLPGLPEGAAPSRVARRRLLHPHVRTEHRHAGTAGEVRAPRPRGTP